jgi:hypothetical protein
MARPVTLWVQIWHCTSSARVLVHALLWNIPEKTNQRFLQVAGKNPEELIQLTGLAKKHHSLGGLQGLQGAQGPDATVP